MSSPLPSLSAANRQVYIPGRTEKILAHVNSLQNEYGRAYEASSPGRMLRAMAESIRTFPMDTLELDELEALASIFSEASSLRLDDPEVRKQLAQKIKEGGFVIIPVYLVEHCLYLIFGAGFYAVCNRGKGLEEDASTIETFSIDSRLVSHIHLKLLYDWRNQDENILCYIYGVLPELILTFPKDDSWMRLFHLAPGAQKVGNCSYANAKAVLRILTAIFLKHKRNISWKIAGLKAYVFAKDLSTHARLFHLDQYLRKIEEAPAAFDPVLLFRSWEKTRHRLITYPAPERGGALSLYSRVSRFFHDHICMQFEYEECLSTKNQSFLQTLVPASALPLRQDRDLPSRQEEPLDRPGPVYRDASP